MSEQKQYTGYCNGCDGTGIYKVQNGLTDMGVICYCCHGTGKDDSSLPLPPGVARKVRNDISYVIELFPMRLYDIYDDAILYQDWLKGKPFPKEMRHVHCPMLWRNRKNGFVFNGWEECDPFLDISQCPYFKDRAKCWARYDLEHHWLYRLSQKILQVLRLA